jgi:hypothetical protein
MSSITGFSSDVMERVRQSASMMGVWYAVALHVVWIALLIINGAAKHATALHGIVQLFPGRPGLVLVLITVVACATMGIFRNHIDMTKILLLVPQQLMLGVSAASGLRAMYLSHFADGVTRSHEFIIADQVPAILALLAHSATIILLAVLKANHRKSI